MPNPISFKSMVASIKDWARRIKRNAVMLWFAQSHQDTPLAAKILCMLTVAYALSPIDLIPDFIPILGYLDEVLLLPALIWLAMKMLPDHVIEACQAKADAWIAQGSARPRSYFGAVLIILIWMAILYAGWNWYSR